MGAQCTTMGERPIGPTFSPHVYQMQPPNLGLDEIEDDAPAIAVGELEPIDEMAASHHVAVLWRLRAQRASRLNDVTALVAGELEPVDELAASLSCSLVDAPRPPAARSNSGQTAPLSSSAQLKSLQARGSLRDESTCRDAAAGGHLEVLQLAHAIGCPWDKRTCDAAAGGGHLEVLLWARSRGCPWGASTCWNAARGGHLAVLQWLRASGCPWSKYTCEAAAEGGHLEVLLWARGNGCPWCEATCEQAANRGDLAMLQWARAHGCPWSEFTSAIAAIFGQLALLEWAHANGCPLGSITCAEIRKVRAETLLKAAEDGEHWDRERHSTQEDFEAVIVWLRANGCPEA
jgi:hypothetical protein